MTSMRFARPAAVMVILTLLTGCGAGLHPIEGQVVWKDGTPAKELAGGQVVFENEAAKTSARGVIQPDGTFKVTTTKPDDGALAGEYKIAVLEFRKNAGAEGTGLAPALLDTKYADFASSGLTATVKPGPNAVKLTVERTPK